MTNINNRFEIENYPKIYLIIFTIWTYLFNSASLRKNDYINNQFILKYGITIEDYLLTNPLLKREMENETVIKDYVDILFTLMVIKKSITKELSALLVGKYNFIKTRSNIEEIAEDINHKLNKIEILININRENVQKLTSKKTCKSLVDIAWIQLSEVISSEQIVKICSYIKCNMIFDSSRKASAYCNPKCQTRAKSHRAYYGGSKKYLEEKPENITKVEKIEPGNINRLPSEKFTIPKEYDADFGFFEDQDEKNRILGS